MDCEYCHKLNNKPIAESNGFSSGIKISVAYSKKLKKASIGGFAHYDSCVGIEPIYTEINYCPMCGREF